MNETPYVLGPVTAHFAMIMYDRGPALADRAFTAFMKRHPEFAKGHIHQFHIAPNKVIGIIYTPDSAGRMAFADHRCGDLPTFVEALEQDDARPVESVHGDGGDELAVVEPMVGEGVTTTLHDRVLGKVEVHARSSTGGVEMPTILDVTPEMIDRLQAEQLERPVEDRLSTLQCRALAYQRLTEKASRGEAWR